MISWIRNGLLVVQLYNKISTDKQGAETVQQFKYNNKYILDAQATVQIVYTIKKKS